MRELGVEGLTEDQRFLIVRDLSTDEQFRVPLGDDAAAAVAGGSAGSTMPTDSTGSERQMDTVLTPREIQARIRRGESPAEVASATGMPLDRIEPFAGPVLAEREYMAEQALKTSVRRKYATGGGQRLSELLTVGVGDLGGSIDDIAWDAARRDDGRWTVTATSPVLELPATFVYDVASRYVMPLDEPAHELVGDVALPDTPDMALADVVRDTTTSVPEATVVEPSLVDDESPLDDLFEPTDDTFEQLPLDDELLPPDVAAAEALLDAQASVASLKEARDRRAQSTMARHDETTEADDAHDDDLEQSIERHDVAVPDTDGPSKKRHERRRVPSWDEIMFGDRRD